MLSARAGLLTFAGRFEEALAYCRRSLAADPNDVTAYRLLTNLTHGRLSAQERQVLARLSQDPELRAEHRISAAFALGDCYDAVGDNDQAFATYRHAQRLASELGRAESLTYDPDRMVRDVDELIARFQAVVESPPRTPALRP